MPKKKKTLLLCNSDPSYRLSLFENLIGSVVIEIRKSQVFASRRLA